MADDSAAMSRPCNLWPQLHPPHLPLELLWQPDIVGIEKGYVTRTAVGESAARIAGLTGTTILVEPLQPHQKRPVPARERLEHIHGVGTRCVVHDDHLERMSRLGRDRL
jgi:hypothetical protein